RERDRARIAADLEILLAQIEVFADALLDQVDRDALFLRRDDVAQDLLSRRERNGGARQRGVGHQTREGAFELAYVGLDGARDVLGDVVRQREAVILGFFLQDRDLGLEVGWLNVGDQAPLETRT